MRLNLGDLSANELKDLFTAVKTERERRGKKNPANHEPGVWLIPNKAVSRPAKAEAASNAA